MRTRTLIAGLAVLGALVGSPLIIPAQAAPDALTVDGGRYYGPVVDGVLHGQGRIDWGNGRRYAGGFERGLFSGEGELVSPDGSRYVGTFRDGQRHGRGRFDTGRGDVYEGTFESGDFTGHGRLTNERGTHAGVFRLWRPAGPGVFTAATGIEYAGRFDGDDFSGHGRMTVPDGTRYEGEFRQWMFHGAGVLRHANGDVYEGYFAHGQYQGAGVLRLARPDPDGRRELSGQWRFGMLEEPGRREREAVDVERALHLQRPLLDEALAAIRPSDPGRINFYLVAIGGYGAQEVFRREVTYVREQFERDFDARGRTVALVNSRTTVDSLPMATTRSIAETLRAVAEKMDRERDILFLFMTSHGSKEHEFSLAQNGMSLRGLGATSLGDLLRATGIRWKVVVVSACYAGGFIDPLKDDHTMVITAARHDRKSFGCADGNDFTYFGRAFFKESLRANVSFTDAFARAQTLVDEWERKGGPDASDRGGRTPSLPQIHAPAPIRAYLARWQAQQGSALAARRD